MYFVGLLFCAEGTIKKGWGWGSIGKDVADLASRSQKWSQRIADSETKTGIWRLLACAKAQLMVGTIACVIVCLVKCQLSQPLKSWQEIEEITTWLRKQHIFQEAQRLLLNLITYVDMLRLHRLVAGLLLCLCVPSYIITGRYTRTRNPEGFVERYWCLLNSLPLRLLRCRNTMHIRRCSSTHQLYCSTVQASYYYFCCRAQP